MFDKKFIFVTLFLFVFLSLILSWRQETLLSKHTQGWMTIGFTEPENPWNPSFFVTNNNNMKTTSEYTVTQKGAPEVSGSLALEPNETRHITPELVRASTDFTITLKNPESEPLTLSRKY
jgi:hypothetical protein